MVTPEGKAAPDDAHPMDGANPNDYTENVLLKQIENLKYELSKCRSRLAEKEETMRRKEKDNAMKIQEAERELSDIRKRYEELYKHMPTGVAIYHVEGNGENFIFKDINKAAEKIDRISKKDVFGKKVAEVFPGVLEFGLFDIFKRVWQTGVPEYFPVAQYKDNRLAGWRTNYVYRLPSGELVAIYEDRTAEKTAEKELQKNRYILEKALARLKAAVMIVRMDDLSIIDCNHAAIELFGYNRKELIGKPMECLFEDKPAFASWEKQLRDAMSSSPPKASFEFMMVKKDKTGFIGEQNLIPLEIENDHIVTSISLIQDITERKTMEEYTRQIHKMEAIGTLAGGIAHDFNNILYPIIGYTEMSLDEAPENSILQENLLGIFKAAHRAKELVKQILTFSRKNINELKPLYVEPIIREALNFLRSIFPSTIDIRINLQQCNAILADPTHIHQIIVNLCTNAFHAMREKGGTLSVNLDEVDIEKGKSRFSTHHAAGKYARLTVSDTGIGMDQNVLEHIFEPYFTTRGVGEGAGLGLSIVDAIVKEHKGFIFISSQPGIGSKFELYFPIIQAIPQPDVEKDEERSVTGKAHILLVDDETQIVGLLTQVLGKMGFQVTASSDSPDALNVFRKDPRRFDLVLTDMTMPGMTGVELSREILRLQPDIPIILSTGYSDAIDEDKALSMGIKGYITKPVLKKELAAIIEKLLKPDVCNT